MISNQTALSEKLAFFKQEGYIVLEDVVTLDIIDRAHAVFTELMAQKVRRFGIKPIDTYDARMQENKNVKIDFQPEGGNHDLNRWNMHLPSDPIFFNDALLANPQVLEILEPFFGSEMVVFIAASDTPYPKSGFQNSHQDFSRFGVTVNIPLVDFTEDNAPLEIWPGTHLPLNKEDSTVFGRGEVNHSKEALEQILATVSSKRMLVKKGAIIIRDQRLVHRGTANNSDRPRPCLSIWYKNPHNYGLKNLTIATPSREAADRAAKSALYLREKGRGKTGSIANKKLLNWGNLYGRVVEELSCSDRDYRRSIPLSLWRNLSPKLQSLLRFAHIDDGSGKPYRVEGVKRTLFGTIQFQLITTIFNIVGKIIPLLDRKAK